MQNYILFIFNFSHKNIKPSNVLLGLNDIYKLSDTGLFPATYDESFEYMSPEYVQMQ